MMLSDGLVPSARLRVFHTEFRVSLGFSTSLFLKLEKANLSGGVCDGCTNVSPLRPENERTAVVEPTGIRIQAIVGTDIETASSDLEAPMEHRRRQKKPWLAQERVADKRSLEANLRPQDSIGRTIAS